ncbi:palmitoyltransferase ZDHHC2-like isoform X2 [Leptotrombidium deliense]|uniref:Palmitoyltransferase n=1 Tax=Leptotrombidium deliense TaxID=299467 RepID=A0A443SC07_9ACAR|nr:palmitoyltransferase ZDHHC2-like isoform X2 [Leptotrombidium deliense]
MVHMGHKSLNNSTDVKFATNKCPDVICSDGATKTKHALPEVSVLCQRLQMDSRVIHYRCSTLGLLCICRSALFAFYGDAISVTMSSVILKVVCLIVFHVLYVMTFWSYWQTIFTPSATVPRSFWFTYSDFDRLQKEETEDARIQVVTEIISSRQLPVICRTFTGGYRLCEKCNLIKPDRAHHCSVCGQCVLKMDHHCPWFVKSWKNDSPNWGKFHILFLFFVSIMFAISLISLFGYHIYLVLLNRSTLESFRAPVFRFGPDKNAFNLGKYHNFCQIFGVNWKHWFLPIQTSVGDGLHYPISVREENIQDLQSPESVENDRHESNQQTQILSPTHKQTNFYNSIPAHSDGNVGQWVSADVSIPMPNDENTLLVSERRDNVGGDGDVLVPNKIVYKSQGTGIVYQTRFDSNDQDANEPLLNSGDEDEIQTSNHSLKGVQIEHSNPVLTVAVENGDHKNTNIIQF